MYLCTISDIRVDTSDLQKLEWAGQDVSLVEQRNRDCLHERSYPAFVPIVSDAFERFSGMPEPEKVPKGTVLVDQDARVEYVYLLRDGLVKLTHLSTDGRESITGLRAPGWYAGGVSAMSKSVSSYSVKTITPCVVSSVLAADFPQWLMQGFKRAHHFTDTLCNELMSHSAKAQVVGAKAPERLTQFMRERTHVHPKYKIADPLPALKQAELAQLLAITPEHLNRLLSRSRYDTAAVHLR